MASTEPSQGTPARESTQPSLSESPVNETRHEESSDSSEDESEFSEEDEGTRNVEHRNRMLQEHFASGMKDIGQARGHKKAAVLLLQWEKEGEDYMDTREEVSN
jgi:TATA-binding protein-associated factor Taf7